ncbi:MAG: hypothetical protein AB8B68_03215 [Rickettsiaceae bacterium]
MKKQLLKTTSTSKLFMIMAIILLVVFCLTQNASAHKFEHPKTWHDPSITKILKTSKIVDIKPMKEALIEQGKKVEFDGQVFLITLENGIKAVFKSLPLDDQGDAGAEVAAYQASLYLGFPYIPPTALKEIKEMKGSLQLFVNTPIDLLDKEQYEKISQKFSKEDLDNLKLFYFVFGQWDSGAHNLLAYSDESKIYPIAIDNSGIRNHQHVRYGELPFVRILYGEKLNTDDYDKPFPFEKTKIINDPNPVNLKKIFGDKLPTSFYKNSQFYGQPLKYIIYQNSLWRQYHAFDKSFVKSYVTDCRYLNNDSLNKLDLNILKKIFASAKGADFLTDSYFKKILERRDQVLKNLQSICTH